MALRFTESAGKHGIPPEDLMYAITHRVVEAQISGRDGHERPVTVFVGPPHGQTQRMIEVLAEVTPPRDVTIFHAMELTDKFRWLLDEKGVDDGSAE